EVAPVVVNDAVGPVIDCRRAERQIQRDDHHLTRARMPKRLVTVRRRRTVIATLTGQGNALACAWTWLEGHVTVRIDRNVVIVQSSRVGSLRQRQQECGSQEGAEQSLVRSHGAISNGRTASLREPGCVSARCPGATRAHPY